LLCAVLLCLIPTSAQLVAREIDSEAAWIDGMLAVRSALQSAPKQSSFTPVVSPVVNCGQAAVPVTADIKGLTHVWLVVGDGGNGTGHDHAAWLDPAFVKANGERVLLSTLSPFAVSLGWNTFRVNKNVRNRPLTVAGKRYKTGLWCHARSIVGYRLEGGPYERFEALGGIDDSAGKQGRVTFEVHATAPEETARRAAWARIVALFPEQSKAFLAELPDGAGETWLASRDSATLETSAVRRMAGELGVGGDEFSQRLAALEKDRVSASDRRWLALFVGVRDAVALQRQATEAIAFTECTLLYVEQSASRPTLRRRLVAWQKRIEAAKELTDPTWSQIRDGILALRREIILSHPDLQFESLLINKRPPPTYSHQCDQYLGRHSRPGPGLVVLTPWKTQPKERVLLAGQLPTGTVTHPDLSFDAKRIAFSYCDHSAKQRNWRRFLLYEIGTDGSGLRQLTGTPQLFNI